MGESPTVPRIAIVGSGAAATAALCGLIDSHLDFQVSMFDGGFRADAAINPQVANGLHPHQFYDLVYSTLRHQRRVFSPPKTHFGAPLPRRGTKPALYDNRVYGGLTNFWGGTLLPFTERELSAWPPLSRALDVAYSRITEIVGVSGADDGLSGYYGPDLVNRPPIPLLPAMRKLPKHESSRVFFGVNRCAIETRNDHAGACIGCGECLAGCLQDAIYSTPRTLGALRQDRRVRELLRHWVWRFDPEKRSLQHERLGDFSSSQFDIILLAAGCLGTTEIVLRSFGIETPVEVHDNATLTFPILAPPRRGPRRIGDGEHIGLANILGVVRPLSSSAPIAQVQIYPTSAYMLRYHLNRWWPWIAGLHRSLLQRLFWVRMFVHSDDSQTYQMRVQGGHAAVTAGRVAPLGAHVDALLESARRELRQAGFRVPSVRPLVQTINSHYGATLPFGNSIVPVGSDAQIAPGIYVCDATCFPEMPAVHPTLTIMAHAYRTARWSIGLPF